MKIGQKIVKALGRRGRSQRWLAATVGVSPTTISKIVAGGETSYVVAGRIAASLEVPIPWLFDDGDARWPPPIGDSAKSIHDSALYAEVIRRKQQFRASVLEIRERFERLLSMDRHRAAAPSGTEAARILLRSLRTHKRRLRAWDEFWLMWDETPVLGSDFPTLEDVIKVLRVLQLLGDSDSVFGDLENELGYYCMMGTDAQSRERRRGAATTAGPKRETRKSRNKRRS